MDEIFRFYVTYKANVRDQFGNPMSMDGRIVITQDHDIRCIDDVREIEKEIGRLFPVNEDIFVRGWLRFADFPSQTL